MGWGEPLTVEPGKTTRGRAEPLPPNDRIICEADVDAILEGASRRNEPNPTVEKIRVTASAALAEARTLPVEDAALLLGDALRAVEQICLTNSREPV